MKTVEKNLLRWHVRSDGMRWEELRWGQKSSHDWDEMKCGVWSASVKCGVWRVQCEVWGKCLLGVALRQGRAQVMFLDNICATASHKARAHGPGWRTAHANSIDSWKRTYSISLRQLPPRFVRVLLVSTIVRDFLDMSLTVLRLFGRRPSWLYTSSSKLYRRLF